MSRLLPLNMLCPDCGATMQHINDIYRCPWTRGAWPGAAIWPCGWALRDPGIRLRPAPNDSALERLPR